MHYPSKLIENAVGEISKLPGIGKKTALRLALHLLKQEIATVEGLANAIVDLRTQICYCKVCHTISDQEICSVCTNRERDRATICVVQDSRDVLAIESTSQYFGLYHVLGGLIAPMEGIGPSELHVESLVERIKSGEVKEVILALNPTMEGDTTSFYLQKKLKPYEVKITTIARGIPVGGELEYADEITLARSIRTRINYDYTQ